MKVCIFADAYHNRAQKIASALRAGAERMGWNIEVTDQFHTAPRADVIAAYGWRNKEMFEAYRNRGLHYLYVDLGYWARKKARRDYGGCHKCVLDARHATAYFQRNRPADRLTGAPEVKPWNLTGKNIIVAGMSGKGAIGAGFRPMEWENRTIEKLKKLTARPIVYRPKPSWYEARPIADTIFSPGSQPIEAVLQDAFALVTHHSNAGVDALAAGVQVYAEEGLASVMSLRGLGDIERPSRKGNREQFIRDVGYCQWSAQEIAEGKMWAQFVDDGLLP